MWSFVLFSTQIFPFEMNLPLLFSDRHIAPMTYCQTQTLAFFQVVLIFGKSTLNLNPHASLQQRCQTLHSSLEQKTKLQAVYLQKTRIRPPRPVYWNSRLSVEVLVQDIKLNKRHVQTWWALQIKSRSCFRRNSMTRSAPKVYETPRSFGPQPRVFTLGSDQRRSQSKPDSGTSAGRFKFLIWSNLSRWGDSPPCIHSIFSSTRAATGKQLKQSVNIFHSLTLNLRLHSS